MSILSEEEVYIGTKKILKQNSFLILAGQPARGVDNLPVVEIKSGFNQDKGSKDSYKPDLVAFKSDIIYIIECKPLYDYGDFTKIQEVICSNERITSFYNELRQRRILQKIQYNADFETFGRSLKGILAYSGTSVDNADIGHIIIQDYEKGIGNIILN